jgi:DNA-binding transcriptional regulator/RsmH inhibitor MraZ
MWGSENSGMKIRVTLDKAGRVVIPKPLREDLYLEPGDAMENGDLQRRNNPSSGP